MTSKFVPLFLALTLAAPAFSQDATGESPATDAPAEAPAATTETPSETAEGNAVDGLSTGEPAAGEAQSQVGRPYTKEVSGDWELRCVRTETPENDPCQLYQLLKDRNDNAVSEISIFRLPAGGDVVAGATIIVPLETLLTAQLNVAIDGNNAKRYPFSFCNQVGCYARVGLTQADVNAYKRGAKGQVQIRPFAAPDQTVTVEMSLTGFTAGFDKVTVVQNQ